MIEAFLGLPQPVITAILLGLFVITLVVAFKVMEMIFQTVTVAALSGAFYVGLTYFIEGVSFGFNDLLLFSFLGASLYMLYSFLATIISTTETAVKIPLAIITGIYRPLRRVFGKVYRTIKREIRSRREEEVEEKEKSTREVVLNND